MVDRQALPEHFNNEFFEKILDKSVVRGTVKVISKNIKMATNPGDNFTSEIYRAKIEYSVNGCVGLQQISLIIKNMAKMETRDEMLESLQCYEREMEMYCQTVPAMSQLLDNEMLCAKCLYATTEPCKLLVFQDLADLNFKLADKKQGLDLAHCKLVLEKLGQFHAASMVLGDRQPDTMKTYNFGIFESGKRNASMEQFFSKGFETLIEIVAKWPEYEVITEKLRKFQPDFIKRLHKCVDTGNDTIRVLNHGDLWINNMLFQYNDESNSPSNVMFLDFQLPFYSSPGIDLNYFLWCSPSTEVRKKHWNEMLDIYYTTFRDALVSMNANNIPSYDDIVAEMQKKQFYAMEACISVMGVILMERQPDSGSSVDVIMNEESGGEFRQLMYSGANYQEAMKFNLKRFDELGVLNE